jgi:hypothetical protein
VASILRHPRWFWLSFVAVLALMLAFRPVTNVVVDVVGTVILYLVVIGAVLLAGRGLLRLRRNRHGGPSAR